MLRNEERKSNQTLQLVPLYCKYDNDPEAGRNLDHEKSPQDVSISARNDNLLWEHTSMM